MTERLRLVVQLKQREEDAKRESLAQSLRRLEAARVAEQTASARARVEQCAAGTASDWVLGEQARSVALVRLKEARTQLGALEGEVRSARGVFSEARARTESVRRVVDTRHSEQLAEEEKREARRLDDLSLLRFARR